MDSVVGKGIGPVFDPMVRDQVQAWLVRRAEQDERIAAAAVVGSLAAQRADQWSDLDLTLGVADGIAVANVIDDWSGALAAEFQASVLLDLHSAGAQYRVFLLPGWVQVDLSFAPDGRVLQGGSHIQLLFGATSPMPSTPRSPDDAFGWGVVFARHGHVCLQRRRYWQAAFCISSVRNAAMDLACLHRGLPARYGRGYDELPPDLLARFDASLFSDTNADDLDPALRAAIGFLAEQGAAIPRTENVCRDLRDLARL